MQHLHEKFLGPHPQEYLKLWTFSIAIELNAHQLASVIGKSFFRSLCSDFLHLEAGI